MSIVLPPCPACHSTHAVKNGKIRNGKQNFKCRECGRQFVQDPQNKIIAQATKTLIDKLLLGVPAATEPQTTLSRPVLWTKVLNPFPHKV